MASLERFEPAQYSIPELHFLLEHAGKPPAVAMRQVLPPGICAKHVQSTLGAMYDLEQIRAAEDGFEWAGVDAITNSITRFIEWHERSLEIKRRGAKDATGGLITYPSQYVWDEDGRAFKFGVDADSAEMVRTEILEDGSRLAFGVVLATNSNRAIPHLSEVAPWIKTGPGKTPRVPDKISDDDDSKTHGGLKCSICGYQERYEKASRQSRSLAMARMIKHLRTAKESTNRHRVLLTKVAR